MLRWLRRTWLTYKLRTTKSSWDKRKWVDRLAATRDPAAAEHLLPLLSDPELGALAAQGLGELRNSAVVSSLVPLLSNPSWRLRNSAACALEKLGWSPADKKTQLRWQLAAGKYVEVAQAGAGAYREIFNEVQRLAENVVDRHLAAKPLLALGEAKATGAIPLLVECLLHFGRSEQTHGVGKSCAQVLSQIEPNWVACEAARKGVEETINRLEREVHAGLDDSYSRRPLFRSAGLVLDLFPEKDLVFRAWREVAMGCGNLSKELSAGGKALLRPLFAALHQFRTDTVIAVLDSSIPDWWKEPIALEIAELWAQGLAGKDRIHYAELLGFARDIRGIQRLMEAIRTDPDHAAYCVVTLRQIIERYAGQLSTVCLQLVSELADECQENYRELSGWSIPYGRGVELPEYSEGTRVIDCRPITQLANDELARRAMAARA